jgi:hypothetical protein
VTDTIHGDDTPWRYIPGDRTLHITTGVRTSNPTKHLKWFILEDVKKKTGNRSKMKDSGREVWSDWGLVVRGPV